MPDLKLLRISPLLLIGACSLNHDEALNFLTALSNQMPQIMSDFAPQSQKTPQEQLARANELIYQSMMGSSIGSGPMHHSPTQSSPGLGQSQAAIENDSFDWDDEWLERDSAGSSISSSSSSQRTTLGSSTSNMSCLPLPPECEAMGQRGLTHLENMSNRPSASIHGSSSDYYCVALIGMEVNRVCSAVYRLRGQEECADLSEAHALEYERAMPSAREAAEKSSIDNIRRMCEWES